MISYFPWRTSVISVQKQGAEKEVSSLQTEKVAGG
jgi:hypothetical protein